MIVAGILIGTIARYWILPKVFVWAITRENRVNFGATKPNRKDR